MNSNNKRLREKDKWNIVAYANLFRDRETKEFAYGAQQEVLNMFSIDRKTLQRVLREYDDKFAENHFDVDLAPRIAGNSGRPSNFTDDVQQNIVDIHNLCLLEEDHVSDEEFTQLYNDNFGTNIAKSTMQQYMAAIGMVVSSAYLKPTLTILQKIARLEFMVGLIQHCGHRIYRFIDLKYEVHVDEKWFYVVRLKRTLRLLPEDERPKPVTIHHKAHIPKVMFLSVIGAPQDYIHDGTVQHFDGKIGLFVFGKYAPAKRRSKNRAAGTPVFQDIPVTCESYREMFVKPGGVLEKIKEKLFWAKDFAITIRHDGAKPHTGQGNEPFISARGHDDGWDITVRRQTAQSPDMNKNDLCFFASLQKKANQIKKQKKDIPSLIEAVQQAYSDYPEDTLTRVHALQYEIYRSIITCGGGNDYPLSHSGIRERQNSGQEVADLAVPAELYKTALAHIAALSARIDDE